MSRIFIITVCYIIITTYQVRAQGIQFEESMRWEQILAKAKIEKKYIFMDVFTTWCAPCKYMSINVFPQKEVGDFINNKFISVKMQMDKTDSDSKSVKMKYTDAQYINDAYKITSFPTLLFFSPEGKLIYRGNTVRNAVSMIGMAEKALKGGEYYTWLERYNQGNMDTADMKSLVLRAETLGEGQLARKVAADYISHLSTADWYEKGNLIFIGQFLNGSNDVNYKRFLKDSYKIDSITGKKDFAMGMIRYLIYREMSAYEKIPHVDWNKIEKETIAAYGSISKDYIFNSKIRYYGFKKNWVEFGQTYRAYFDSNLPEISSNLPFSVNELSWRVVEHVNDFKVLETAIKAMKNDLNKVEGDKDPANIDTFANLLYKAGKKQEAIEWEEKAVKLSNNDKNIVETLEKMKSNELIF